MRAFSIPDDMYSAELYLIINCTADEVNEYCRKKWGQTEGAEVDKSDNGATLILPYEDGKRIVIWIKKWGLNPEAISALVHEVYHATNRVMEDVGIAFHIDSDDAYAYYLEKIMGNCLTTLKRKK